MTQFNSESPFDDIRQLLNEMPGPDLEAVERVRARDIRLTKPHGSLGRLEELVEWLAAWQGGEIPSVDRPLVAIFAGNHGITEKGVSAFPSDVTKQMIENFTRGGAAINQICKVNGLALKVFELALDIPTPDISEMDAFDESDCAATVAFGMEAIADTDLLIIGEMGIGNTSVAAAIYNSLFGGTSEDWVGLGTGVDDVGLKNKIHAVEVAVDRIKDSNSDPLEVLRRVGGREIAAMVGAILASRIQRIPVIVDGFVATSAAAILYSINQNSIDHCQFGHMSAETAHRRVLAELNRKPLLELNMRLGEGTGAALAAGIVKTAVQLHNGMATFDQAGVSNKNDAS